MKVYLSFGTESAPDGYTRTNDWTFENVADGSVEEVLGTHVLDKIPNLTQFGQRLHVVLASGGKATFDAMYFRHPMAWVSPKTVRGISEHTMGYLNADWRKNQAWAISAEDCKELEMVNFDCSYGFNIDPNFEHRSDDVRAFALSHYASSIPSIKFILVKK